MHEEKKDTYTVLCKSLTAQAKKCCKVKVTSNIIKFNASTKKFYIVK